MKNPFKFKRNHLQPEQPQSAGASSLHLSTVNSDLTGQKQPGPSQPVPAVPTSPSSPNQSQQSQPAPRPHLATDQTLEYLKKVELDDVLELMYPRLVTDQKTRLEGCTTELEEIDRELTKLHLMRDDVLNAHSDRLASGVAKF